MATKKKKISGYLETGALHPDRPLTEGKTQSALHAGTIAIKPLYAGVGSSRVI